MHPWQSRRRVARCCQHFWLLFQLGLLAVPILRSYGIKHVHAATRAASIRQVELPRDLHRTKCPPELPFAISKDELSSYATWNSLKLVDRCTDSVTPAR